MFLNFCFVSIILIVSSEIVTSFGRFKSNRNCKKHTPKIPNYNMYNLRPSQRKCLEYIWIMDEREQQRKQKCKRNVFVIRGQRTKPAEYPHMGALGWISLDDDWVFLCGSTLISENFVLTAAHCTKKKSDVVKYVDPKIVRLGVLDIYDSKHESPLDVQIKRIIPHHEYQSPKKYNDIALMELNTKVEFTKFVHPACLLSKPFINKKNKFTVTGWGVYDSSLKSSHQLRYAELDLYDSEHCDKSYLHIRHWKGTFNQQLCAGKADGSVDTCFGDSGGPLQHKIYTTQKEGTMHMVVGITSFGATKCALPGVPGVYTNVATFINWIENIVWPEKSQSIITFP